MKYFTLFIFALSAATCAYPSANVRFVDPKIGSEGLGRTYIGPCVPFGMAKPSPDGVTMPNSGWAPMPEPIKGFSQVHVSGTGGGQKYGNILVMPYDGKAIDSLDFSDTRQSETIELGYYSTTLSSGVEVELTSADKAVFYHISYPSAVSPALAIDAGAYLGMSPIPDGREAQQLVGSQIEIVSDYEVKGYNRVRGGWNNGRAYTVYFYAVSDVPFANTLTWCADSLSKQKWQTDRHLPTGALLTFSTGTKSVNLKIGISFISELKAKDNLQEDIPGWNFSNVRERLIHEWESLLSKIDITESASDRLCRMFYTGLYHTLIMPTDRSGENPLWADDTPYYDDYYAIWDTYRTSSPMITLLDPQRETDIINSMLSIYRRDGYLPDARSGNSNGRTQGGSNAELVIADAYVKNLPGIDYRYALQAMLKDADVPPGGNEEAEGRGGLVEYNRLGYIPYNIPRAGNRTVEYSLCDFAIAQVAKGLGEDDVYRRFIKQASNWKNLWREDYEHLGSHGFIMPRNAAGEWVDSLTQGHSASFRPKYAYTPLTFEGPWYTPWWDMFMYEASSWEYSLSVPHDVPGLIEKSGGKEAFERRLDTFFDKGIYNVNNEPSFLTPYLYHWLGLPHRSADRIREIIAANYSDKPEGLPGNDDSGAMSSWLAFNMIGLYPNAGHSYYLIGSPLVESTILHLYSGKDFIIRAEGLSDENRYVCRAFLNGEEYVYSSLNHSDLMEGGELTLVMGSKPGEWGAELAPEEDVPLLDNKSLVINDFAIPDKFDISDMLFVFKLHGQTRRYRVNFDERTDGTLVISWGIERNLKWQQGTISVSPEALEDGNVVDMRMPVDGEQVKLDDNSTAYTISRYAFKELKGGKTATINNTDYRIHTSSDGTFCAVGSDGSQMWVLDNERMPVILAMYDNPLNVNWSVKNP